MPRQLTPEQIEALRNPSFLLVDSEGCRFCGVICRNECESVDEAKTCANMGADLSSGTVDLLPVGKIRSYDGQCAFDPVTWEFRMPIEPTRWQRFKDWVGRFFR